MNNFQTNQDDKRPNKRSHNEASTEDGPAKKLKGDHSALEAFSHNHAQSHETIRIQDSSVPHYDDDHRRAIAREVAYVNGNLALLEISRGYIHPFDDEPPISAIRDSLMHDVDDDVFSAAVARRRTQSGDGEDDYATFNAGPEPEVSPEADATHSSTPPSSPPSTKVTRWGQNKASEKDDEEWKPAPSSKANTSRSRPVATRRTTWIQTLKKGRGKPNMGPGLVPSSQLDTSSEASPKPSPHGMKLRRSTRNKTIKEEDASALLLGDEQEPEKALDLEMTEGFMPSAANNYRFKYDSPSGRTAADLDKLLKSRANPKKFPMDGANTKSYKHLGELPKPGLADRLMQAMEDKHAQDVEKAIEEEEGQEAGNIDDWADFVQHVHDWAE